MDMQYCTKLLNRTSCPEKQAEGALKTNGITPCPVAEYASKIIAGARHLLFFSHPKKRP